MRIQKYRLVWFVLLTMMNIYTITITVNAGVLVLTSVITGALLQEVYLSKFRKHAE